MSFKEAFRGYFARVDDPYAGGDLANAQRLGSIMWTLLVVLAFVLVPLNPPTKMVAAGWLVSGALIAAGVAAIYAMRAGRFDSWHALLVLAYATAIAIAVVQWFSGGQSAPYRGLFLLPVLLVASTQPPRRIAPFMLLVLVLLAAPFLYDSWDATRAQGTAASFVIWCALAVGASVLMMGVRAQRVVLQAEGEEARAEARIDSLTGLPNRRAFDEQLMAEIERARRQDVPLSVAMVDIENFKEVNDRWSYLEGDRCLREVSDAMRENVRRPDFCFRWGGDEFALILSGTRPDETGPIEERLHQAVSATCLRPDDMAVQIRFAVAELGPGMSARELTEIVGLALTAAKMDDDQETSATSSA
jgi:diguanylate cyclase (GGDEF)-like protein